MKMFLGIALVFTFTVSTVLVVAQSDPREPVPEKPLFTETFPEEIDTPEEKRQIVKLEKYVDSLRQQLKLHNGSLTLLDLASLEKLGERRDGRWLIYTTKSGEAMYSVLEYNIQEFDPTHPGSWSVTGLTCEKTKVKVSFTVHFSAPDYQPTSLAYNKLVGDSITYNPHGEKRPPEKCRLHIEDIKRSLI